MTIDISSLPRADREVPRLYDHEAEEATIGSLLIADLFNCELYRSPGALNVAELVNSVKALIHPEDFIDERLGRFFRAICTMEPDSGDEVTVIAQLREMRLYRDGDEAYAYHLITVTPIARHAAYYAGIVKEFAERRRMVRQGADMVKQAYHGKSQQGKKALRL